MYGLQDLETGGVDTENVGALFGSVGVVVFIFALGAFLSVSFATRSLETAVAALARRLRSRGWLLIAVIMVLFSALGSTMGFSVETFGFYALLIPLMAALGYDRMVTAATILLGATTGPAEDTYLHETATEPFAWELGWWFPQLAMLFVVAALVVAAVARMGEARTVQLLQRGMGDMIGPALVIVLARGVAVIMNNTRTLDTVLYAMENAVSGASQGVFAILVALVNVPLAILIPSSSGHATLAMPLLAPLSDFAGVTRPLTITAFQMGHGWALLWAPTNVVVVAGLALARVGYDKWLRFVWPFLLASLALFGIVLAAAAALG